MVRTVSLGTNVLIQFSFLPYSCARGDGTSVYLLLGSDCTCSSWVGFSVAPFAQYCTFTWFVLASNIRYESDHSSPISRLLVQLQPVTHGYLPLQCPILLCICMQNLNVLDLGRDPIV